MKEFDFTDKKVLDFGTGTGILAILSKRMGAISVTAIDNDENSIENAKENIIINHTPVQILQADNFSGLGAFDIILANINLNTILANQADLKLAAHSGSLLIISGFLQGDQDKLVREFSNIGFTCKSVSTKESWVCITFAMGKDS